MFVPVVSQMVSAARTAVVAFSTAEALWVVTLKAAWVVVAWLTAWVAAWVAAWVVAWVEAAVVAAVAAVVAVALDLFVSFRLLCCYSSCYVLDALPLWSHGLQNSLHHCNCPHPCPSYHLPFL